MTTGSFCLDVGLGYDERYREELIAFLKGLSKNLKEKLGITKAERGMWEGVKILRIQTTKAEQLQIYILENTDTGDDNDYRILDNRVDADRCMVYLPDYDTDYGYAEFDL